MPTLTDIRRYPVKSLRGESMTQAVVEPWGLAGDRRWMLVDEHGAAITAREVDDMLLIRPRITAYGLAVRAPHRPELGDLEVETPDPGRQVPVSLWDSSLTAAAADAAADAWFSTALDRPARLVHLDDPRRRPTSPTYSLPDDRVSFADGYPLLLATEESLAAVNAACGTDLSMVRFRPSIVVAGFEPWAEDDWRRLRIGDATFRAVKGCARCVMTTVDPDTGHRGKEPIAGLAKIRRWDGATWFGINLIPDSPTGSVTIGTGDQIEILDAVPPGNGPIRPARS